MMDFDDEDLQLTASLVEVHVLSLSWAAWNCFLKIQQILGNLNLQFYIHHHLTTRQLSFVKDLDKDILGSLWDRND